MPPGIGRDPTFALDQKQKLKAACVRCQNLRINNFNRLQEILAKRPHEIPLSEYAKIYAEIEDVMMAKGAPVYLITLCSLELSPTRLAA